MIWVSDLVKEITNEKAKETIAMDCGDHWYDLKGVTIMAHQDTKSLSIHERYKKIKRMEALKKFKQSLEGTKLDNKEIAELFDEIEIFINMDFVGIKITNKEREITIELREIDTEETEVNMDIWGRKVIEISERE